MPVDGREVDAARDDEQARVLGVELRQRAVRDGDPLADARRLELLALDQDALDLRAVDAGALGEHLRERLEGAGLVEWLRPS